MRRIRGHRRQNEGGDGFGVSLMDLLTAALGCVLLIFIVYSVVTSGDLQRFLAQNTDLVEALKERDRLIALKESDAIALRKVVEELNRSLSEKERQALEARARQEQDKINLRKGHAKSLQQLFSELQLLRTALDPRTARPVDVMLVIDGTNSMAPSLQAVRQNLRAIIGALQVLSPTARIGITVYRDRREKSRIRLQYQPLSSDANTLKKFLEGIEAKSTSRDRDRPEWMCGGLRAAILGEDQAEVPSKRRRRRGKTRRQSRRRKKKAQSKSKALLTRTWRDRAIKIVVVVSDAGTNSPKARDCIRVAERFREQGGQVHIVSTLPKNYGQRREVTREYDDEVLRDHAAIAQAGGGEHIKRASESTLLEEVLRSAFRSRLAELEQLKKILRKSEDMKSQALEELEPSSQDDPTPRSR